MHVLHLFESAQPQDPRPRHAIEHAHPWVRGEVKMMQARAAAPPGEAVAAGRHECQWQRGQLPGAIRELVLDDQRLRNEIFWSVFDC